MNTLLYHKGKQGELRQWRVWTEGADLVTEHGVVGGALQFSRKTCTSKNVGRSNETTPEQQAIAEAHALHKFKLERKYSLTPEAAQNPDFFPMLAHKFDRKKHSLNPRDYCSQPKLDGVRCIASWKDGKVVLTSRQGKVYDVKHISDELEAILEKDTIYDGELYIHNMPLQQIISLVKKPKPESLQLEYHIYDIPVLRGQEDLTFRERYYEAIYSNPPKCPLLQHVPLGTNKVTFIMYWTPLDFDNTLNMYLEQGYEGMILRTHDGLYTPGYRSNDLLKVKNFLDDEFIVVDMVEGVGKMAGHAIVVCQNDLTDATFKAAPKASMEERKRLFENKAKYIGKKYTVRYFDRTDDQIPRFPIGIAFREDV